MSATSKGLRLRQGLLAVVLLVFLGTTVELWLIEHTHERPQYIPFVLIGLGVIAVLAVLTRPRSGTIQALRGVMVLVLLGSVLGIYLHLRSNFAFELDIRPGAQASEVIMESLRGANPVLAPGVLAYAAIVALIASYDHPVLSTAEIAATRVS